MSKRALSELDIYEEKPELTSSDSGSDIDISRSKVTKSRKPATKKLKTKNPEGRNTKRIWTPEEDRIFLQIMGDLVKAKMWEAVQNDGRLGYRGSAGIYAHTKAVFSKLKKP